MSRQTTHVITGDRVQVYNALARAYADGRLVSAGKPRFLPGDRVELVARLRTRSRWEQARPWLVTTAKALAVLAALAAVSGVVWLVVLAVLEVVALVVAVVAWVQAHLGLLVLGAVVLVFLGLAALSGGCRGMHCRGCRG